MPVTYPLNIPTNANIRGVKIIPRTIVSSTISAFTGAQQIQAQQGKWFEMEVELSPMRRADAEEWNCFFLNLNGIEGSFLMGDPAAATPRGAASTNLGTPVLDGAHSIRASTINLKGAQINIANYVRKGDYLQLGTGINSRLHKILSDGSTNAAGKTSFDIFPPLRAAYADNSAIIFNNAKGLFRLASNDMSFSIDVAKIYSTGFACREVL